MRFVYKEDLVVPKGQNIANLFSSWDRGVRYVCITGGRGKGKTVALWLYLLMLVRFFPGIKIVVARSAYSDIAGSFVATGQDRIFKYPLGDSRWQHPKNPFVLHGGIDMPKTMRFQNGSEIRFIGLQDPNNRRGIECDVFVLNEGTLEKTSEVWGTMGATQSGGRRGGFIVKSERFSQMITDTNPSHKFHWLYRYFHPNPDNEDDILEEACWLKWTHRDNPVLVDADGALNAAGEQTLADLHRVYGENGFEAMRMIHGIWCNAEGAVYDMWDPKVHEVPMQKDDFPVDTLWHIGVDHGGGPSPFAVSLTAQNGRMFRTYKEFGMSLCTVESVIKRLDGYLANAWGVPKSKIDTLWGDVAVPSFQMAFAEAGYPVMPNVDKDIKGGIDSVKQIISEGRYLVNKGSMESRCPYYDGPQGFKEEVLAYQYMPKDKQRTARNPDLPIAENNHWLDERRYLLHGLRENVLAKRKTGLRVRFAH